MIICPDCKKPVEETAVVCEHCGSLLLLKPNPDPSPHTSGGTTDLSQTEGFVKLVQAGNQPLGLCRVCGLTNAPAELFCQNCGAQIIPEDDLNTWQPERLEEPDQRSHGFFILRGHAEAIEIPKAMGDYILGRSDPVSGFQPSLDLTPFGGERGGVSRRHLRVSYRSEGVSIEDLNSTNFTFLNRIKLEPGRQYPLNDLDEIRLGLLVLIYRR